MATLKEKAKAKIEAYKKARQKKKKKKPEPLRIWQKPTSRDKGKGSSIPNTESKRKRVGEELLKGRIYQEKYREGHRLSRSQVTKRVWDKMTWNPPPPKEKDRKGVPSAQEQNKKPSAPQGTKKKKKKY